MEARTRGEGNADAALLDSYEEERLPVARRLLNTTDRAFMLVVSDNPLAGLLRTQILARLAAFAMSFERVQRVAFRVVSQTGIHYRGARCRSRRSHCRTTRRSAGDRFPWLLLKLRASGDVEDLFEACDDTRFNLIVFGQPAAAAEALRAARLLHVHPIPDDPVNGKALARAKIPALSFYLLRPDGHIGFCGTRLDTDAIDRYMSERMRVEPAH